MSLISVFYPLPCEGQPYTKAIVPSSAVTFFCSEFGFFKTQAEAIEAQAPEADPGQDSETDTDETQGDETEDSDEKQAGGAESYVDSGDEGCGALNSKKWCVAQIKQAGTRKLILDIVKTATGKTIRKKTKKVADLKLIAIDLVERCFDGNSE